MTTYTSDTHTTTPAPPATPATSRSDVPRDLDASLAEMEEARARQLQSLPTSRLDPVTAAYRGSVTRILEDIRTARHRLAAGLYGVCLRCDSRIADARLELRPWATTCTDCERRRS
jgi:RNA polymerase-binding transcription factor DksA